MWLKGLKKNGKWTFELTHWTVGRWFGSQSFQYVTLFPGDTLLQQKLQESNMRLYTDVGQAVRQVYGSASREVRRCT